MIIAPLVDRFKKRTNFSKCIPWFVAFCSTVCRFRYTNFCSERIRKLLTLLFWESDTTTNFSNSNIVCVDCTSLAQWHVIEVYSKHLTFGLIWGAFAHSDETGVYVNERQRESVCVCVRLNHAHIHSIHPVLNQLDFAWIILVVSPRLTWGGRLKRQRQKKNTSRRKNAESGGTITAAMEMQKPKQFIVIVLFRKCGFSTIRKWDFFLSLIHDYYCNGKNILDSFNNNKVYFGVKSWRNGIYIEIFVSFWIRN